MNDATSCMFCNCNCCGIELALYLLSSSSPTIVTKRTTLRAEQRSLSFYFILFAHPRYTSILIHEINQSITQPYADYY